MSCHVIVLSFVFDDDVPLSCYRLGHCRHKWWCPSCLAPRPLCEPLLAKSVGLGVFRSLGLHPVLFMVLPRWIEDPTCDSPAMLAAYIDYHTREEQNNGKVCSFTDLYMVVHRPDDAPSPAIERLDHYDYMSTRLCNVSGCQRCAEGRGGYMFRWYHPAWEEVYMQHRRPGAWAPGADFTSHS